MASQSATMSKSLEMRGGHKERGFLKNYGDIRWCFRFHACIIIYS